SRVFNPQGCAINRLILLALLAFLIPITARADCVSPAGSAGKIIFAPDRAEIQYCNGMNWVGLSRSTAGCQNIQPWANANTVPASDWNGIAYGNNVFVATATFTGTQKVMTSPDGMNWTPNSSLPGGLDDVAFGNGIF